MKKTKEECLLMNGIMSFDLGKNETRIMKAMDDFADDVQSDLLINFANKLNEDAGYPFDSTGIPEYVGEYLKSKL